MRATVPRNNNPNGYAGVLLSLSYFADYYPFGWEMPGRGVSTTDYRYGFNGKETDQETGWQDYGFRIYNPRVGRFFRVDPISKSYPYLTPYQFASNGPTRSIDLDGLEQYVVTVRSFIPDEVATNPASWFATNVSEFKGDNRMAFELFSSAYRTEQSVYMDFTDKVAWINSNIAASTTGYEAWLWVETGNELSSSSGNAGIVTSYFLPSPANQSITTFNIGAPNKLSQQKTVGGWATPSIDADITVILNHNPTGGFEYSVFGSQDGFPAYEIWLQDLSKGTSHLLYGFNPAKIGNTPISLFPGIGDQTIGPINGNNTNTPNITREKF